MSLLKCVGFVAVVLGTVVAGVTMRVLHLALSKSSSVKKKAVDMHTHLHTDTRMHPATMCTQRCTHMRTDKHASTHTHTQAHAIQIPDRCKNLQLIVSHNSAPVFAKQQLEPCKNPRAKHTSWYDGLGTPQAAYTCVTQSVTEFH